MTFYFSFKESSLVIHTFFLIVYLTSSLFIFEVIINPFAFRASHALLVGALTIEITKAASTLIDFEIIIDFGPILDFRVTKYYLNSSTICATAKIFWGFNSTWVF